jgi:hypothetical protein
MVCVCVLIEDSLNGMKLITCASLLLASGSVCAASAFPAAEPGVEIGSGLPSDFEPSGAAWHPRLQKLFVCSDAGRIASMASDGSQTLVYSLAGNWEGITVVDPSTNVVYAVSEDTGRIVEFNFQTQSATRAFNLLTATAASGVAPLSIDDQNALIDNADNRGAEALAFVPNESNPVDFSAGEFYVGSQENGFVYRFRLDLLSGTGVTYLGKFKTWLAAHTDLASLEYDPRRDAIIAGWDNINLMRALGRRGEIYNEWILPISTNDEEGIAVGGPNGSSLFIAEDPAPAAEVYRFDGLDYFAANLLRSGFE